MTKEERNELTDLLHCAMDYFLAQSRPTVLEDAQRAVAAHAALKKAGQILAQVKTVMGDEDGWIEWKGGSEEPPVDGNTRVEAEATNGFRYIEKAKDLFWGHEGLGDDIVRYRVLVPEARISSVHRPEAEEVPAEQPKPQQGGEWIEWEGGECPVPPEWEVQVRLRNGDLCQSSAGDLLWDHGRLGSEADIIRYRGLP